MKKALIKVIMFYQKIPGDFHYQCRYIPSCSDYAIGVIEEFGVFKGIYLSVIRFFKCNPWNKNKKIYDPIPKRSVKN